MDHGNHCTISQFASISTWTICSSKIQKLQTDNAYHKACLFQTFFLQFCSKTCFVLLTNVLTMSSTKLLKHHHQDQPFVKWKIIEWGCVFVNLGFFFSWKKDVNLVLKSTKKNLQLIKLKKRKHFSMKTITRTSHKQFRVILICGIMKSLLIWTKYCFNYLKLERCLE